MSAVAGAAGTSAGTARLDLRLVPAAVASWSVTAAGIVWSASGFVALMCATIAGGAGVVCWRGRRRGTLTTVAAMLGGGALIGAAFAVAIGLRVHELAEHPITERYGTVVTVTVSPAESPRTLSGARLLFRAQLLRLGDDEMTGRVVVFAPAAGFAELSAHQPVSFAARVSRPTRRDLTVAALSATGKPTVGDAAPIYQSAHRVRSHFADAARAVLHTDEAAMVPALVLGDLSAVTSHTTGEFRAAGLTHLTAVSGANVTIVCAAVLYAARVVGPRLAVLLAGLALVAFVVVVEPSASVLRAGLMGAISLLAIVTHRRRQAVPVLSATVIALMIWTPELAVDAGFALSVAATAALVVLAPRWSRRLVSRGWPRLLADAVVVALAAELVTAPLVAAISGTFSIVSVAANLAAAPVVAPITVLGTAAAALSPIWPVGAQFLIRFTGPETWWLLRVAHWAAAAPGATVPVGSGVAGLLTVAAGMVTAVVVWRWRWARVAGCVGAVALLAWTLSGLILPG